MARILVVEDDFNMRFLIAKILQKAGYETREAENGQYALQTLANDGHIDLVISDFLMPQMGGLEFLTQMRDYYPQVPVIMLSVHTRFDWVEASMEQGAACYLLKPFTREQLVTAVGDVLAARLPMVSVGLSNKSLALHA
jgi:DNA-binding NtrC family response regulator